MKRKIELLAPGGDVDAIKAAIVAGADAVYCGLDKFNARNRATNITFDNLLGIIRLAHKNSCEVFLTLNIIVVDSEMPALINLLNKLVNTSIDGVIVQDLGVFYLLSNYFKSLKIHASTQLTTHNEGQIKFLNKLNASRVNLSRELNINEISALSLFAHKRSILTEVFVHGSYCLSFSGLCYMSSVNGGKSGNRGRCSQPCRDEYFRTSAGKSYPLNLKDNSAYFDLIDLYEAGINSLKIEGRIKEFEYVFTVVNTWKKLLESFYKQSKLVNNNSDLYKVFNRDFSNSYLKGAIHKDMFIDHPMSYSTKHHSKINNYSSNDEEIEGQQNLYDEKAKIRIKIKKEIDQLSVAKVPIGIKVSGEAGALLSLEVLKADESFVVHSESVLVNKGAEALNYRSFLKRLKAINDTEYYIEKLDLENLSSNLFIPFNELTSIKRKILFHLNGSKDLIDPIELPALKKQPGEASKPTLSVLISSPGDVFLCEQTTSNIYYQLPNAFQREVVELIVLFNTNKKLVPWFPSVLIGNDYAAALEFIEQVQPKLMVTNNTGIAYEAFQKGIEWIAGPFLNTVNSYSLLSLKENFNCAGAFLSNEMSKVQIKGIKKPGNFKLYFSIYHPIELMTSRQCLFHQVTGCEKNRVDDTCIPNCEKSSSITNLKKVTSYIEKSKGNYHRIYHSSNYLNMEIVADFPNLFSDFLIDLRAIKTETKVELDKLHVIRCFEKLLAGNPESGQQLKQFINPTTCHQYKKGI